MSADLELRITVEEDERTLVFELASSLPELNYFRTGVGSVRLSATPRQQLDVLFDDLSRFARRLASQRAAPEQAEIVERLAGIGQGLYRDLFPDPLKLAYQKIRALQRSRPLTLLIISDEPWIPWELAKPYDETGGTFDDPFFCEQFYLARWLAGAAPRPSLEVNTLALVVPDSNLEYTRREVDYFAGLAERAPEAAVPAPIGTARAVRDGLRDGAAQLWHFACHGNFVSATPDRSLVQLEGGDLYAEQIVGPVEWGVRRAHPMITLNACKTGQQGFALTGLGGWAERLIKAGASAFIGAQWDAHDALAAEFAVAFYDALWAGAPLGQAAHAARMRIKAQDASNPTWLCYAVYGDPQMRVSLKGAATIAPAVPAMEPAQVEPVHTPQQVRATPTHASAPPRVETGPPVRSAVDDLEEVKEQRPAAPFRAAEAASHATGGAPIFDQRGQRVRYQYNAAGNINFGAVRNEADLVGALEELVTEVDTALEAGVFDEATATDVRYALKKAILQAKKPRPDRNSILAQLGAVEEAARAVPAAAEMARAVAQAAEKVQQMY